MDRFQQEAMDWAISYLDERKKETSVFTDNDAIMLKRLIEALSEADDALTFAIRYASELKK